MVVHRMSGDTFCRDWVRGGGQWGLPSFSGQRSDMLRRATMQRAAALPQRLVKGATETNNVTTKLVKRENRITEKYLKIQVKIRKGRSGKTEQVIKENQIH